MTHIAFVVPSPALVPVVHEAWALHDKIFGESQNFDYTVDCELSPDVILSQHYNADVIVSRGGTAAGLKKKNYLTPVVEIPVTVADLTYSIEQAISEHGPLPIGVVGTINTIRAVFYMEQRFPVPVKGYATNSVNIRDLIDGMKRAVADGCKLILAGHNVCHYCAENGIPAGLIYSSKESVFLAITEAKRCANVSHVERENSTITRSVIDHVQEGIIAVDQQNLIRIFNPAAEKMLGRKAQDCIGHPVNLVLPEGRLSAILSSDEPYTNTTVRFNGNSLTLSSVPMSLDGRRIGTLVSFNPSEQRATTEADNRTSERTRTSGHTAKYHFDDILGDSPAVSAAIHQSRRFARVDSNILLYGETGTGKELFAQSIHNESERANEPFVAINCAAIPENLMESELFGYEAGAFTGANKGGKAGLFEAANNGTIFLDEISEISTALQSRLLRVIQEREIRRIGANRVIPINVRIICATNQNLMELIRQKRFREDLYYRLKVLSVQLPPLRSREGDVQLLMQHYLTYYARKFGKGSISISPEAARAMAAYSWPGNIRELRNISEQLAVLCDSDVITMEDIAAVLPVSAAASPAAFEPDAMDLGSLQRRQIIEVLSRTSSRKKAAELLGISKTTLWRKCKELGLN